MLLKALLGWAKRFWKLSDETMKIYSTFRIGFKKISFLLNPINLQIKYFLASCVTMPKRCLIYISGDYRPAQQVQNRAVIPLEQNKIFYRGYKG